MGRTRKDARMCTSFVVHDGKALTRELLALCPSLQREYELPKWCTNTHAQTLIGSQILVDDDGMLLQVCKTNHRSNYIWHQYLIGWHPGTLSFLHGDWLCPCLL